MNTLEKSLLIKELHDLTDALKLKRLSLYETAKAKARIKDIFMLCDEPIFQKQLLTFKALQNPIQTAATFAEQSLYAQSFRGVFTEPEILDLHFINSLKQVGRFCINLEQAGKFG